jgi:hypothetical protein
MLAKVKVNPIIIVAEGNTIAMIDGTSYLILENHNAWVIS